MHETCKQFAPGILGYAFEMLPQRLYESTSSRCAVQVMPGSRRAFAYVDVYNHIESEDAI